MELITPGGIGHTKNLSNAPGTQSSNYRSLFMRVFPALGRYLAVTETEHFRRWNTYLGVGDVIVVGVLWGVPPSIPQQGCTTDASMLAT